MKTIDTKLTRRGKEGIIFVLLKKDVWKKN